MPATAGVTYLCKSDPPSLTYTKQPEQRGPSSLALSPLEQKSHRRHNSPTPHLLAGPWRAGWSTQQSPVGAQCSLDTLCCSNVGRKHRSSMTLYHVFTVLGNFPEWCLASLPLFPSYLDFWLYWKQRQPVCHMGQVIPMATYQPGCTPLRPKTPSSPRLVSFESSTRLMIWFWLNLRNHFVVSLPCV